MARSSSGSRRRARSSSWATRRTSTRTTSRTACRPSTRPRGDDRLARPHQEDRRQPEGHGSSSSTTRATGQAAGVSRRGKVRFHFGARFTLRRLRPELSTFRAAPLRSWRRSSCCATATRIWSANHPADEAADDFRSRKLLVSQGGADHPPPPTRARSRAGTGEPWLGNPLQDEMGTSIVPSAMGMEHSGFHPAYAVDLGWKGADDRVSGWKSIAWPSRHRRWPLLDSTYRFALWLTRSEADARDLVAGYIPSRARGPRDVPVRSEHRAPGSPASCATASSNVSDAVNARCPGPTVRKSRTRRRRGPMSRWGSSEMRSWPG